MNRVIGGRLLALLLLLGMPITVLHASEISWQQLAQTDSEDDYPEEEVYVPDSEEEDQSYDPESE